LKVERGSCELVDPRSSCEDRHTAAQVSERIYAATLKRLLEAYNAHDIDAVMSFFADDCVLEMPRGPHPWGRRMEGRARVRRGLASRLEGIPTSTMAMIATG
jgi:ketosteroid isomerase-like protein